jgi:hypothetical protein
MEVMHDAHGQRGLLLQAQVARPQGQAHQPESEQIAAVKGEVEEGGEIDEEGIGEMLGLIDVMSGAMPRSSTKCTRLFLMAAHNSARRWAGRGPISRAKAR